MKYIKSTLFCFLLVFVSQFISQEVKACHAIALVNITPQTPIAGGIIVNASSDSPTCGCAVYWLDVEVRCIGEAFNGAAFSPGFYGPLNTYPFYQSAQMNKPNCVVQAYPGVTIMFAPLCPGTTYQYRMRENHNFSVGPWCATQTFVVPGVMPTFSATIVASANNICAGSCSTLTATPTGGCQIAVLYNWSTGATGSSITVCPTVTTTYTCAVTDDCSNQVANLSMTIIVLPAPIAGTASVSPGSICSGQTVNLNLVGSSGTIQWQSAPVSGGPWTNIAGATTAAYTTGALTANTCFQAIVSGCGAPVTSNTVCITINPAPVVVVNSPTICAGASATLTATGATTYLWDTGSAANPLSVTPAATTSYTVTGTTAGCTGSAIATVTVTPLPIVTVNSPTICNGAAATLTGAGATSYAWSTGAITNPISVTPTTTTSYTVTGTAAGCTNTAVSTVTVTPLPPVVVNSPTVCPGQSGTLTAAGATSYVWSTGAITNPITVTPATTTSYTVTGTAAGCTNTAVATVTVGGGITVTVSSDTICSGQSTSLTANGGVTYLWDTGSTLNPLTVSPTTTTTYTVTGTTAGCTGTAVATVTVNPLPITVVNSVTICDGVTATLTAGGASTYTWTAGATATGITTADASPSTTTTYTVTGSTLGCTSTAVATVTVNPIPLTVVNSPSVCPTFTANLVAGGASTYTWSAGATATGVNTADATPAVTTSYTVTGTSLGCSSTAVATVTVNPGLVVDAGLNDSVCFGASTVLNVTPNGAGYSYAWTPAASLTGPASFNPTATPATTTTYSVLVTDAAGCTGTSSVTIYADPQITLAIAGIDVTCNGACNGQTIVIPAGGTPAYTYSWSSGCTTASCSSLCIGTYTVTVTDAWGCTTSDTATVIEPSLLTASVSATTPTTCNAACDGTATAAGAGGTIGTGYTYSWNSVPAQTTATATGLCAGSYTCTITDANGCTATTVATITEPTVVVIAPIASATVCTGGSTTLTAVASGGNPGGYNYVWMPTGTGTTDSVTVTPVGTTTYTVIATDALNNCPAAPVTATVTVNPGLSVAASGTTSICPGASATISALAALGNGGPYTYTWAPAGTGTGSPVSVSPAVTTTYTVTADDGCSPTATATVTITVLPLPVVSFSAPVTAGCEPLCVNFTDNSTVAGAAVATWAWDFGDGNTASTSTPTNCYAAAGSYDVTLTTTSTLGGCTSTLTMPAFVTVHPNPVASFSIPASTSIISPTVSYTDNSTISTGTITAWNWSFGDPFATGADSSSSLQNPTHTFTEAGIFCATLTVTSNFGCMNSTSNCIVVEPEFTFFIPNAFSPNGDGVNDEFFGMGDFIKDFELFIYDRWGNLIFYTDDLKKHWDGRANHGTEIAQEDVYVYLVKITDHKDKKHKYTGTVTIVK